MDIEWLMLADAAEVVGNKLYVLGGGWDMLSSKTFPLDRNCAVALSFRVPWSETNQQQPFRVAVVNADGDVIGGPVEGHFMVGRPPTLPQGADQRFQLVINLGLHLKQPSLYAITASVADAPARTVQFHALRA